MPTGLKEKKTNLFRFQNSIFRECFQSNTLNHFLTEEKKRVSVSKTSLESPIYQLKLFIFMVLMNFCLKQKRKLVKCLNHLKTWPHISSDARQTSSQTTFFLLTAYAAQLHFFCKIFFRLFLHRCILISSHSFVFQALPRFLARSI